MFPPLPRLRQVSALPIHQLIVDAVEAEQASPSNLLIGIPIAIVAAALMSLGAKYQHRGVTKINSQTDGEAGVGMREIGQMLKRPSWLVGTLMLGAAIALQLVALMFAPVIVVQPLGVVSLVLTTLIQARDTGVPLSRKKMIAVALSVAGVAVFVTIASLVANEGLITNTRIWIVLGLNIAVLVAAGIAFAIKRAHVPQLVLVVFAGALYGFVVTLAKVFINGVQYQSFDWVTLSCGLMVVVSVAVGAYLVQLAYAKGQPDVVIAGLTVIDPMVAVAIGILVLGEADGAPWFAFIGFIIAGAIAVAGVLLLAREEQDEEASASPAAGPAGAHAMSSSAPSGQADPAGR